MAQKRTGEIQVILCWMGLHKTRLVWSGEIYFLVGKQEKYLKGSWQVYECYRCGHEKARQINEKPILVSKDCSLL